ncbi:hypothetical protein EHF33_17970 (plasmid) [Deinococcus psychrotolerans]|uniref:Uncharacterized protein n=1 Tax=Deinococcus psychrotolerans TaxID=2489213 RepID=A0A3G8YJ86_9DEIO|nr:hypothetical protein EHF33_17970 [Deinococcus psychrotolerans]
MLGMALLRDRSIQVVCDHLHLILPDHTGKTTISSAGLVQARDDWKSPPQTPVRCCFHSSWSRAA